MERTLAQELNPRQISTLTTGGAIILLFFVTYLPALEDLNAKYSAVDSYYSHGYLIPLVSLFVIWHKRNTLKSMRVEPSAAGLWVLGGGLLLYLFSRWFYVNFAAASSMLIVLTGLALYLFGKAITKQLMFPLAFLLFMIPLPKISIIYITFWLKMLAASAATEIVYAFGIPLMLHGALIELPNGILEVDNACSGLRSLIALTALGVAYAYFLPVSLVKKCVFLLVSVPIAMLANLSRIIILIVVSYLYSPAGKVFEWADFTTGMLIFVFAFLGLGIAAKGAVAWEGYGAPNPRSVGNIAGGSVDG